MRMQERIEHTRKYGDNLPYHHFATQHELTRTLQKIERAIYSPVADLHIEGWITPEPVPFAERQAGRYVTLTIGQSWGKLWDCAWFHFTGTVPRQDRKQSVVLLLDLSGEAYVVDSNGCPVLGLTTVSSDFDKSLGRPGKRVVPLFQSTQGEENIDLWVEAGCNDLFGKYQDSGTIKEAHIALYDEQMEQLYYDFAVLHELMTQLSPETARFQRILAALHKAMLSLIEYSPTDVRNARALLASELAKSGGTPSLNISAIGHAHIDLAWLWPIRETIRKGARSFSTVLANMERYPDYIFGASQPQLYQWMKDYYPSLYAKIHARVHEGRWETQGAMWVEPDTNLSGGEALVRQVLYGKRFYRQEFGTDPRMLWLPDVFGYTAALPQILKKAGVDYFLTIKLSWNSVNTFPHHTFLWQGLDGSTVLAHMPPEGTYNSSAAPRAVSASEKNFADKAVSEHCALLFGIGDGGGGPGIEHLERLKREKDLAGLAPVKQETMESFFARIAQDTSEYKTWVGELYLEKHQGTYTTQARNKRFNRKIELALRDLEFVATIARAEAGTRYTYPTSEIEAIWKEVLLYQFHDILPGSSITRVYDESLTRYQQLFAQVQDLLGAAQAAFIHLPQQAKVERPVTVFNTLSWQRSEWLRIHDHWHYVTVPPLGYAVLPTASSEVLPDNMRLVATEGVLENECVSVHFASDGSIASIFDKEHLRDVLAPGHRGNKLAVYDDDGDAWDFSIAYDERPPQYFTLEAQTARIDGPLATVEQTYRYGESFLRQSIILTTNSRRIDFVTNVDWRESGKMLRTSFPVAIRSQQVTCDIQFGVLQRPTHHNTSWDMARYEICAHKWVDLSQPDYGVALLNDCKYGHKVQENVLDLHLLRSPGYPDPQADRAQHEFTYALYPHAGDHINGAVMHAGYELNVPLFSVQGEPAGDPSTTGTTFASVNAENIVIEAVKKAEDSDAIVIRLYETSGISTRTTFTLHKECENAWLANLLEEPETRLEHQQNAVELEFKPFEILTLLIHIAPQATESSC